MPIRIDPERNEIRALKTVTDWRQKLVMEIGCGEGRLTRRLARLGAIVHANEPDAALIAKAKRNVPRSFTRRIRFRVGQAEKLNHASKTFDIVVFSWVL